MDHLKYSELQTLRFVWSLPPFLAHSQIALPERVAPSSAATSEDFFSDAEGLLFQIAGRCQQAIIRQNSPSLPQQDAKCSDAAFDKAQ